MYTRVVPSGKRITTRVPLTERTMAVCAGRGVAAARTFH